MVVSALVRGQAADRKTAEGEKKRAQETTDEKTTINHQLSRGTCSDARLKVNIYRSSLGGGDCRGE